MSVVDLKRVLIVFACLEFVLAGVMIAVLRNVAIGASQIAIGGSLIAIAMSADKKKKNG